MTHGNHPEPSPAEIADKVDGILDTFHRLEPAHLDALARAAETAEAARLAPAADTPARAAEAVEAATLARTADTLSDYHPARYPYITAYCTFWGSFLYYRRDQHALAARDGVPDTAYREDRWDHLSTARRDKALAAEKAGTAIVIRDPDGNPQRVWYLIDYLTDAELRAILDSNAEQIRAAHNPPA